MRAYEVENSAYRSSTIISEGLLLVQVVIVNDALPS